eukprot:TRINITY_DN7765_c0_g1_i1.p1 TRINITY_DN7765_c0_g1~~TRINITY_DN7765_c0_g1_i1.p1  ORF type:complete len:559 (+),score=165.66 TRINITY_DN7765_c0_g1_i1:454-2130(+)
MNENEEGIRNEHGVLLERVENCRLDLGVLFKRSAEARLAFDEGTKCAILSKYNTQALMAECELGLGRKEVLELDQEPYTDTSTFRRVLEELLNTKAPKRRREALEATLKDAIGRTEDQNVLELILPVYDILHSELLSTEHIKEALRQMDEKMALLEKGIAQVDRLRQTAMAEDDMKLAETYHDKSIELQEQLLQLLQDRLAPLTRRGGQDKLLADLEEHNQRGARSLDNALRVQTDLIERLDHDLAKLGKRVDFEAQVHSDAVADFKKFTQENDTFLQDNQSQQDQIMGRVTELVKELDQRGRERIEAVRKRAEVKAIEEKRLVEFAQFVHVSNTHKTTLETLLGKARGCIDAIHATEDYLRAGSDRIHRKLEDCDRELADLRLKEHKGNLAVTRRYYLCVGELLYRKEKQIQELDRILRSNDLSLDFVKETLDVDREGYRNSQRNATATKDRVVAKVNLLKDKLEDAAEKFQFTADALDEAKIDYVHPAVEMQEVNVERRSKALALRKQYQDKDLNEVNGEASNIQKVSQLATDVRQSPRHTKAQVMTPRRLEQDSL